MDESRVLILDGDGGFRAEVVQLLSGRGYMAVGVGAASQAVAALKQSLFDCAVVDVQLDDIAGLDAIPQLRTVDPRCPIIVTARENTRELEARVRQQNPLYYYVKNFDRADLLEAVGRAVSRVRKPQRAVILVVDDDRDYQQAVRLILEGAGYEVVSAYTKDEGLAALKKVSPDLVILDIMMTRMTDGFHFLYQMRADKRVRKPPVLSISIISKATGMSFSPTTDGEYFPADDFLTKPVQPGELLAHVRALLAGYRPPKGES